MHTKTVKDAASQHQGLAAITLRQCELFRDCTQGSCELLLSKSRVRRFDAQAPISSRGDRLTHLGVVLSGSVEIGSVSGQGRRFVRWYLEPGQVLGLVSVLDGKGALYDSRAHEPSLLLLVPRDALLSVVAADAGVMRALIGLFCRTSRLIQDAAREDVMNSLQSRVARSIVKLAESYGQAVGGGITISLKLSQEEFASMLAVPRQRVNRELKLLQEKGLIELAYSTIVVRDRAALQRMAVCDEMS